MNDEAHMGKTGFGTSVLVMNCNFDLFDLFELEEKSLTRESIFFQHLIRVIFYYSSAYPSLALTWNQKLPFLEKIAMSIIFHMTS